MSMQNTPTPIRFFMGANTPGGFVGYLDDLYDPADGWRAYLIKSGPGTGKSSLMRRVLEQMANRGLEAEAIFCSSDPDSLDGVRIPALKACIVDATAPHVIEPKYWGAVEQIVNLSACMDARRLHESAPQIMEATAACSALHARCRKFLGAAASLLGDSCRIAASYTDPEKILRSAARIAAREFGGRAAPPGSCSTRPSPLPPKPNGSTIRWSSSISPLWIGKGPRSSPAGWLPSSTNWPRKPKRARRRIVFDAAFLRAELYVLHFIFQKYVLY